MQPPNPSESDPEAGDEVGSSRPAQKNPTGVMSAESSEIPKPPSKAYQWVAPGIYRRARFTNGRGSTEGAPCGPWAQQICMRPNANFAGAGDFPLPCNLQTRPSWTPKWRPAKFRSLRPRGSSRSPLACIDTQGPAHVTNARGSTDGALGGPWAQRICRQPNVNFVKCAGP